MMNKENLAEILGFAGDGLLEEIGGKAECRKLTKGEILVCAGDLPQYVWYLVSGVLKGYSVDQDGRKFVDFFVYRKGEPVTADYDLKSPAQLYIEAASDACCMQVPMAQIKRLLYQYPELAAHYNRYLEDNLCSHMRSKQALCRYDAVGRYRWFLEEYSEIVPQITQKDIAAFLDMTPVTLSRVRRKLRGGGYNIWKKEIGIG